ncbi:methyl-accepting chemotaxis protein [Sneathiella sp. P13V-1]|uniref:methyl-accepting chemotaxis protein n=1 Tax=Sneathiella sp. P13V-1 TaxID=2697366 RepID=UPI00187B6891|nr:methyl-accepting chemotaxis protein [Sneathiella sp. P13V-1]MBE7635581.1 methyl-accepting chemotaxis protein [Sneathiella sp. P13V-1]
MTSGSSHFKMAIIFIVASVATAIVLFLSNLLSDSTMLQAIVTLVAFVIPAAAATVFWRKGRKAEQERDNMRSFLEARASELAGDGPARITSSLDDEIKRTTEICLDICKGNFENRIRHITPGGELEDMQWAINELVDRTDAFMREAEASMEHVSQQKYYRRIISLDMQGSYKRTADAINACTESFEERLTRFDGVIQKFENGIWELSNKISETSTELQDTADTLSNNAGSTNTQVERVSTAANSATGSVQTVASAAEELSASISEISRQVNSSLDSTGMARETVEEGNTKIQGLAEAVNSIGEVVKLIEDIASQTNLLALNATIEAARAGEAGKGFAVVANEVKNLATQTARATEEISQQILDIQTASGDAVQTMDVINTSIGNINMAVETIATAIEEQGSATREISESVVSAASNTQSVSEHIGEVRSSAETTNKTSKTVLEEANSLQQLTHDLEKNVLEFLNEARKAI